ncbi:amino acid racemase [Patescibacteria group bacterium]|nr:amino acid racemase [Patescibacteria group bacterium]
MKSKKAIGILGGIGPQASLYLCKLLIELSVKFFGVKNNADFPEIILDSIPIPGFIANDYEKKIALKMLKQRVIQLDKCDVLSFCIVCNTAHLLLNDLQQVSKTPFLSMIKEVALQVSKDNVNRIGLLASPATIREGLYQEALKKKGVDVLIPTENIQRLFKDIVENVLKEKNTYSDEKTLLRVANSLKKEGAQGIILGCTELPLVFPKRYSLPIYNCVEILAMALLRKYYT